MPSGVEATRTSRLFSGQTKFFVHRMIQDRQLAIPVALDVQGWTLADGVDRSSSSLVTRAANVLFLPCEYDSRSSATTRYGVSALVVFEDEGSGMWVD